MSLLEFFTHNWNCIQNYSFILESIRLSPSPGFPLWSKPSSGGQQWSPNGFLTPLCPPVFDSPHSSQTDL